MDAAWREPRNWSGFSRYSPGTVGSSSWIDSVQRWQATIWLAVTGSKAGTSWAQRSTAIGQRVRNTQPDGGLIGEGSSPERAMRVLLRSKSGSGTGTADSSAWV